jgi:uncharacterized OB-fold protein
MESARRPVGSLLGIGVALPTDRVPAGRARRCAARPDEDAVTLAAEAGVEALEALADARPAVLVFASTTAPYDLGGSVQALAELLRLDSGTAVVELTSVTTDGLAALRVGLALAAAHDAPALVIAAHDAARSIAGDGDGAVALLVGPQGTAAGLAELAIGPGHVEELRDRWRLRGEATLRDGDSSFVGEYGGTRIATQLADVAGASMPVAVSALDARIATKAESALGGPGDPVAARTGLLGAAHPLLRIACGLDGESLVVAVAGGIGESVRVRPEPDADSRSVVERALGGADRDAPVAVPSGAGFDPYASGPRAWRERGQDLRLEGVRYGEHLCYPPPAAAPPGHADDAPVVTPLARTGTVLTHARDHVYPGGEVTQMVVLDLDDGARFYCQMATGEEAEIGDRVRLVPRRLHQGGGVVQYFWKAAPCR